MSKLEITFSSRNSQPSAVAREFQTTCRAWLPAPCRQELQWVPDDPFAAKGTPASTRLPTVMRRALFSFELLRVPFCEAVHRARARRLMWAPSNRDWRRVFFQHESYTPDVARFVQRLRPRLIRGFEGDGDYLEGDTRALDDEHMHNALGRTLNLLHEVVSLSVEGVPGCVLYLEFGYFYTHDEWDHGEEIFARLSFCADGGELRELCIQRQGEVNGDYLDGQHYGERPNEIFNPKFWITKRKLEAIHHLQAFASRLAVNDPLRTDWATMRRTLIGVLHYSFEVFANGGRDYGSWVPVTASPRPGSGGIPDYGSGSDLNDSESDSYSE